MHVALPGCTKAECCLIEVVVDAYGERDSTALVVSVPAVARRRAYLGLVTARSSPRATTSHARSGETSRESPGAAGSRREPPSATTSRAQRRAPLVRGAFTPLFRVTPTHFRLRRASLERGPG